MSTEKYTIREFNFEDVCERALKVLNSTKQKDLADSLGISPGDLANRKKREAIPYDKLVLFADSRSVSLDWLLTGKGSMYRDSPTTGAALTPEQQALLTLFNDLSASDQREILHDAEKKKRLDDLEQQVATLLTGTKK